MQAVMFLSLKTKVFSNFLPFPKAILWGYNLFIFLKFGFTSVVVKHSLSFLIYFAVIICFLETIHTHLVIPI